jgi:hypothetical protein
MHEKHRLRILSRAMFFVQGDRLFSMPVLLFGKNISIMKMNRRFQQGS